LLPICRLPGLRQTPAQELDGYDIVVFVDRVDNISNEPIELDETACAGDGVLGAAAWPQVRLEPGQSTELYIAVRTPDAAAAVTARPSVARSTP
jgi:conjugal transfer pilus assembly protein TraK